MSADNSTLAASCAAAAAPQAGQAELVELVAAARSHEGPLASLITSFATSPPPSQESPLHTVFAEPHTSPGYDTWSASLVHFDALPAEPQLFRALAKLLDAHTWPAWTRQVTGAWVERFLDPDFAHPALGLFRGLDFDLEGIEPDAFAKSPHARHLTHLRVAVDFIAEAWRTIASNQHLREISHLMLHGGEQDAVVLVLEAELPALRHLDLASCDLEDEAIEALVERGVLRGLQHLDLGCNPDWGPNNISSRGLAAVAEVAPVLRYLDVSDNEGIDDEGVIALCASPCAGQLRTFHASGISLGREALVALAQLEGLEVLSLGSVDAQGLQLLGAGAGLERLHSLSVWPFEDADNPEQEAAMRAEVIAQLNTQFPALETFAS